MILALCLGLALGAPPAAKASRDPYGAPNVLTSTNLALRWGSGLDAAQAQAVLDTLELAWAALVDGVGYPEPPRSADTLLNVYVGSSGGGTPSSGGADAAYGEDPEGWPMLVLSLDVARDMDTWGGVAAHELVHALQDGAGRPYNTPAAAWWWEAHAVWTERLLFPDKPAWARFAWACTFAPELALDAPGDGRFGVEGLHPWGAGLWPIWLDEAQGQAAALHQTWLTPGEDPLAELRAGLGAAGLELEPLFHRYALELAAWQVGDPALLQSVHEEAQRAAPGQDRHTAAERRGTMDLEEGPAATLPQPWGFNILALRDPEGGPELELVFEPEGDPAAWGLGVVLTRGQAREWVEIDLDDGAARLPGAGDVDRAELVVAFTPADPSEPAAYRWRLAAVGAEDSGGTTDPPPGGCARGCAGVLGFIGLRGWRRRGAGACRRAASPAACSPGCGCPRAGAPAGPPPRPAAPGAAPA